MLRLCLGYGLGCLSNSPLAQLKAADAHVRHLKRYYQLDKIHIQFMGVLRTGHNIWNGIFESRIDMEKIYHCDDLLYNERILVRWDEMCVRVRVLGADDLQAPYRIISIFYDDFTTQQAMEIHFGQMLRFNQEIKMTLSLLFLIEFCETHREIDHN